MPEPHLTVHIDALVDRARTLRRDALDRESRARVELFIKLSGRTRVTRTPQGGGVTLDHAHESGLALRVMSAGRDCSGFAATSGLSTEALRWALDVANSYEAHAPCSGPGPMDVIPSERWDCDPDADLPSRGALAERLVAHPEFEWLEAGTTLEVLVGAEGWLTGRRRHRVWALESGSSPRLVAQRGFDALDALFDGAGRGSSDRAHPTANDLGVLGLTPDAASPVVTALVDRFHVAGKEPFTESGPGWTVADEPERPDALSGGSFDDVGFQSSTRVMAEGGSWRGEIGGPGSFWRTSFRQPPMEHTSNLVVPAGDATAFPDRSAVARRCRVLKMSSELWVLELELESGGGVEAPRRHWVRVNPRELLDACTARLGGATVTSGGPIVPGLLLEGLTAASGK